jgi:hypothetical protein
MKQKKEKQKNPRKTDKKTIEAKKPKNLRKPNAETKKLGKTKNNETSNGPARVGE